MKKSNKSVKARKAAQNRGKKRSDRLKVTQAVKHERKAANKKSKEMESLKFQQYLDGLMPQQ